MRFQESCPLIRIGSKAGSRLHKAAPPGAAGDDQASVVVWPQCGQVWYRSPARHGFNTAAHLPQKIADEPLRCEAGSAATARTRIRWALGSCQRTEAMPFLSWNSISWLRLMRAIASQTTPGERPRASSNGSRPMVRLWVTTSQPPSPHSLSLTYSSPGRSDTRSPNPIDASGPGYATA